MNTLSLTEEERKAINRSIIRLAKGARFELTITVSLEHAALANSMEMPLSAILEEGIEAFANAQGGEKLSGTPTHKKEPTIIAPRISPEAAELTNQTNQERQVDQRPLPHEQPRKEHVF